MKKLSDLRKERKLSQVKLGKQLGLSGGAIAMYETGKRTPNLERAILIANFFDLPVESISFSNELKDDKEVLPDVRA